MKKKREVENISDPNIHRIKSVGERKGQEKVMTSTWNNKQGEKEREMKME